MGGSSWWMNTKLPSNSPKHITPGVLRDVDTQDNDGLIPGSTNRRRQCSISDEEVEKALDVAAVLLAVADDTGMKGWGLNSPTHCLGSSTSRNYYRNNNNNNNAQSTATPKSKYAAILASVSNAPPSVQTCPLSLLSSGGTHRRTVKCSEACSSTTSSSSKKTSLNLKTFSATFNCRVSSSPFGLCTGGTDVTKTSPSSPGAGKRSPKHGRLKSPSSQKIKKKEAASTMTVTASTGLGDPESLPVCHSQASTTGSPSKATFIQSWSSSSSPSSSSSVATIECESISVTIPDRPKCVMTSSWANEESRIYGSGPTPNEPRAVCTEYDDWLNVTMETPITASPDADCPINTALSTVTSSDPMAPSSGGRHGDGDADNSERLASALSKKALLSSRRRHRQRPLSLPSNHQLDLKLCYFNPDSDLDLDLDKTRTSTSHPNPEKSKRHSLSLRGQGVDPDEWHSQLHPLLHSQSQIIEGHDLSRVAKVKILSRTSWCDCSPDFLSTSRKKKGCSSSPSPEKEPPGERGRNEGEDAEGNSEKRPGLTSGCRCPAESECECGGRTGTEDEETGKMHIPKAPSDEFLTEAMKFTRQKLRHRCIDDLVTLLEQFYKQTQSVSEELVGLLQQRHDLLEQVDMRKIAIEQLVRLQNEAAASNDVSSVQMSIVLPGNHDNRR